MKNILQNMRAFVNRAYRLTLDADKQEKLVWEDLKKLHAEAEWSSGVFEADKYIETVFSIADKTPGIYHYLLVDNELHSLVKIIEGLEPELISDAFLLASHFNNRLKVGVVEVDVSSSSVFYRVKKDILIPLLYTGDIYDQLMVHYNTSKDIYWAYQKLANENDEPAIIFADLLRKRDEKQSKTEN